MKRLLLVLMLILGAVTITSRPVQTYAYTEEQKQQAKSWLSAHGYPPTYQDYMDGKIDVPEADAYLGRNKQKKIEEKNNSTSTTNKTSQKTGSEDTTDTKNTDTKNTDTKNTESQTSATSETTTTTTEKTVTTETKEQQKQKEEKKKQEQKKEKKKHMTGITIAIAAVAVFAILVLIMRKKMYFINKLNNIFRAGCKSLPAVIAREPYMA